MPVKSSRFLIKIDFSPHGKIANAMKNRFSFCSLLRHIDCFYKNDMMKK